MSPSQVKTVNDFMESIPAFPEESLNLTESSQKLLEIVYGRAHGLSDDHANKSLKPPLIISFHPKASLLNNNIHETYIAEKLGEKFGMVPIWLPYIYDTGFKSARQKIRRPTYVYFEGKYIPIRTAAAIAGNVMATEKALSQKEIKTFFRELEKHELSTLTQFRTMLNKYNFGHFLFDYKRYISSISKKVVRKRIQELQKLCLDAIKGTKKLDESLALISQALFKQFGINIPVVMMDDILSDLVKSVLTEVLETPSVKNDPSLLEGLFLAYDLKSRDRTPISYAGDLKFIAFDDSANRLYDGTLDSLVEDLKTHKVLPTGHMIMLLFTAMGCKLVLGGSHTMDYYPDYFIKAETLLKETSFNSKMQLFSYGKIRFIDLRNLTDVMSVMRVFDKVGSRNYIKKGEFTIPTDVIDHLCFLAGEEAVPFEFEKITSQLVRKFKYDPFPASHKEHERYQAVLKLTSKSIEELLEDPSELKQWLKSTDFETVHPVKLELLLDNLKADVLNRYEKIEQNIAFELHILGGQVGLEEEGGIIYDGLVVRSHRYPTLLELVFYDKKPEDELDLGGDLGEHDNEWIWKQFIQDGSKIPDINPLSFSSYPEVFNHLIPPQKLVNWLKPK